MTIFHRSELSLARSKRILVRLTGVAAFGVFFAVAAMVPASADDEKYISFFVMCDNSYTFIKSDPRDLLSSDQNDGGVVRAWGTWPGWNEAFHLCTVSLWGDGFQGYALRHVASDLFLGVGYQSVIRAQSTTVGWSEIFERTFLYRNHNGPAYSLRPKNSQQYLSASNDDGIVRADANWVGWYEAFIFPDGE